MAPRIAPDVAAALDRLAAMARRNPVRALEALQVVFDLLSPDPERRIPGLTPAESCIVKVLQSARGGVVSHEVLVGALDMANRGRSAEASAALLKTFISHIRQKQRRKGLDLGGEIETIHCFGYRFVARGDDA